MAKKKSASTAKRGPAAMSPLEEEDIEDLEEEDLEISPKKPRDVYMSPRKTS